MKPLMRTLVLTLALLPFAACHEIGHIGDATTTPGGSTQTTAVGEVRDVNTSTRQIELRTDAGRTHRVNYDSRTRVLYQNKEYSPSNLESGDYVDMRIYQDGSGRLYSDEIRVRQSSQERASNTTAGRLGRNLVGDVVSHDNRTNQFELQTDGGRKWTLGYHQTTEWRTRGKVSGSFFLNQGDYVSVTPRQDSQGRIWADVIDLRQNRQERNAGAIGGIERFEGTVEYLDRGRGLFEVRNPQNRLVIVTIPFNPKQAVNDRFNRLRVGETIRLEGRFLNNDRLELVNFL